MTVDAWLDRREPAAPEPVRRAMGRALTATDPDAAVPDRLAAAALVALEQVTGRPSERETAHTLLAADALLTYACEAAAESGVDAVRALTDRLDFDCFSELMASP